MKLKRFRPMAAIIMCIALIISTSGLSYAISPSSSVVLAPNSPLSFEDLPSHIQSLVQTGDYVFEENEHYYILPSNTGENTTSSSVGTYATYNSPRGGSVIYSNPIIESSSSYTTYLLSVSYIPQDVVTNYLIYGKDPSAPEQVAQYVAEGLMDAAISLIATLTRLELAAPLVSQMASNGYSNILYSTYNSVKSAYTQYCYGLTVTTGGLYVETKYVHNNITSAGNLVTTFSRWTGSTVNTLHYNMLGTWKNKIYYAGGESIKGAPIE